MGFSLYILHKNGSSYTTQFFEHGFYKPWQLNSRTSTMKNFCKNTWRLLPVNYFRRKAPRRCSPGVLYLFLVSIFLKNLEYFPDWMSIWKEYKPFLLWDCNFYAHSFWFNRFKFGHRLFVWRLLFYHRVCYSIIEIKEIGNRLFETTPQGSWSLT